MNNAPSGNPELLVKAEDQTFPQQYGKVAYESLKAVLEDHMINLELLNQVVGETQMDMLDAGFVKVVSILRR